MAEKTLSPTVVKFLVIQRALIDASSDPKNLLIKDMDAKDRDNMMSVARQTYGALHGARVFDFDPGMVAAIYQEIDKYTTEEIGGEKWSAFDGTDVWADRDSDRESYYRKIVTAGRSLPLPEHVPFPVCYFGFGEGMPLSREAFQYRFFRSKVDADAYDFHGARVIGILLDVNGIGAEFVQTFKASAVDGDPLSRGLMFQPLRVPIIAGGEEDDIGYPQPQPEQWDRWTRGADRVEAAGVPPRMGWNLPFSLNPWLVCALVNVINGYRNFVLQDTSLFYRMTYAAKAKKAFGWRKAIPPPFYQVTLQEHVVREHVKRSLPHGPRALCTHRFDVRGHERCKIARGTLPLDPKLRVQLEKRKYRIFTVEDLDMDTWRLLSERRLPGKRPGEWLAIKRKWVADFQKGPAGAPYIPATRRVPRRKAAS